MAGYLLRRQEFIAMLRFMNDDQIKGAWSVIKGKAKMAWGDLTDDDVLRAEGSVDRLYGIIQRKFGDTKEVIKKKLDDVKLP